MDFTCECTYQNQLSGIKHVLEGLANVMQLPFPTVSLWTAGSWLNQILHFRLGLKCEGIKCFIQILQLRAPREWKEKSTDTAGWKIQVSLIQSMWALEMRWFLETACSKDLCRENVLLHFFLISEGYSWYLRYLLYLKFADSKLGSCFFWRISVKMVLKLTFSYSPRSVLF